MVKNTKLATKTTNEEIKIRSTGNLVNKGGMCYLNN